MRCKECKDKFEPKFFNQKFCLLKDPCIKAHSDYANQKEWKKRKAKLKNELKTHSDYVKGLQIVFNTYIRLRDSKDPCISCKGSLGLKYDAGHYYSCGGYPSLRFNELNVHAQCVHCNQHLGANLHEYKINLLKKIGAEAMEELEAQRHQSKKYSIPELIELTEYYKAQIKIIKNNSY